MLSTDQLLIDTISTAYIAKSYNFYVTKAKKKIKNTNIFKKRFAYERLGGKITHYTVVIREETAHINLFLSCWRSINPDLG